MTATPWTNKIVGHAEVNPADLIAHPLNFRAHPDRQRGALKAAIKRRGFLRSVTVNQRTGRILDGHLRVGLALLTKQPTIPVEYVDVPEAEEVEVLLEFDPISAMADEDNEILAEALRQSDVDDPALLDLRTWLAEEAKLLEQIAEDEDQLPGSSLDDQEEQANGSDGSLLALTEITIADPTNVVATGDVWRLGEHVLICRNVFTDWREWTMYLDGDNTLFVPYPGPFVPLTIKAEQHRLVMVQPDPYVAGHILDRYENIHGKGSVSRG